jgi:hypothetical protein
MGATLDYGRLRYACPARPVKERWRPGTVERKWQLSDCSAPGCFGAFPRAYCPHVQREERLLRNSGNLPTHPEGAAIQRAPVLGEAGT